MFLQIVLLLTTCYAAVQTTPCCPPGWTEYNNNCYRYFSFKESWYGAHSFCDTVGSRGYSSPTFPQSSELASILNSGEQSFLCGYWKSSSRCDGAMWIGLYDPKHNRVFEWSDGSRLWYTNWNQGEPNNHKNQGEYYVTMLSNCKWNDEHPSSSHMFGFTCKMRSQ